MATWAPCNPTTASMKYLARAESYVEFTPDISNDLMLEVKGSKIYGRFFRQDYELRGGNVVGHYANGTIAAVEHNVGQGRTLLLDPFPVPAIITTTLPPPEISLPPSSPRG